MTTPGDIFAKQRLTVGQLRAVADRRFGDALALAETGENARANGAQYLAGIVIEILLKGQLLQLYPQLASLDGSKVDSSNRRVWNLVWRSHSLEEILDELPLLRASVQFRATRRASRTSVGSWESAHNGQSTPDIRRYRVRWLTRGRWSSGSEF